MSVLIFESMFCSRIHHKNLESYIIYEHYFNYICWPPLLAVLVSEKSKSENALDVSSMRYKICQNLHQRRKVKNYMCSDTLNGKNCGKYVLHCNGIDPFVTSMSSFNWGPISRNDIVSKQVLAIQYIKDRQLVNSC